jgi:hypothetical protein
MDSLSCASANQCTAVALHMAAGVRYSDIGSGPAFAAHN